MFINCFYLPLPPTDTLLKKRENDKKYFSIRRYFKLNQIRYILEIGAIMSRQDSVVKESLNLYKIEEIIGERVQLKKKGKEFVGLCPFHDEKTPSFTVNPIKQLYHCFGCKRGGSVIDFLMEFDHQSFTEVIKRLTSENPLSSIPNRSSLYQSKPKKTLTPTPDVTSDVTSKVITSEVITAEENYEVGTQHAVSQDTALPCPYKVPQNKARLGLLLDAVSDIPKSTPLDDQGWAIISTDPKTPQSRAHINQIIYRYSPTQEVWGFEWSVEELHKKEKTFRVC
jgi:CHC2 zinc finger